MVKKNIFKDRKLVPLDQLIAIRTKKVQELISTEEADTTGVTPEVATKKHRRIDEYSSIVTYLCDLQGLYNEISEKEVKTK